MIWQLNARTVADLAGLWVAFPRYRALMVGRLPAFTDEKQIADLMALHKAVQASPLVSDHDSTQVVYHVSGKTGKCWCTLPGGRLAMVCPPHPDVPELPRGDLVLIRPLMVPVGWLASWRKVVMAV